MIVLVLQQIHTRSNKIKSFTKQRARENIFLGNESLCEYQGKFEGNRTFGSCLTGMKTGCRVTQRKRKKGHYKGQLTENQFEAGKNFTVMTWTVHRSENREKKHSTDFGQHRPIKQNPKHQRHTKVLEKWNLLFVYGSHHIAPQTRERRSRI